MASSSSLQAFGRFFELGVGLGAQASKLWGLGPKIKGKLNPEKPLNPHETHGKIEGQKQNRNRIAFHPHRL